MQIFALLAVVLCYSFTSPALASDQRGTKAEQRWKALEDALADEHQATDTESLIELSMSNHDNGQRWLAIEILGLRGEKKALKTLRQLISDQQPQFLRETAALALARLGDPLGLRSMREFMAGSASLDRQIFLAARLAEFGDPSGFTWVRKGALGESARDRYLSVAALIPFTKMEASGTRADAEKLLLQLGQDKDASIRQELFTELPLTFGSGVPLGPFLDLAKNASTGDSDQGTRSAAENLLALWRMEHPETGPH